jgi:hypothetical protein
VSFDRARIIPSIGLAASVALGIVLAMASTASANDAPAADKTKEAAAPADTAAPAKAVNEFATGEIGMNYTPTAGAWRDKLIAARKHVLKATAAVDDVNAEYARVLYEHPDDKKRAAGLAKQRAHARQQLADAKSKIPVMVEQARADGVSERVLDLYEQSLED